MLKAGTCRCEGGSSEARAPKNAEGEEALIRGVVERVIKEMDRGQGKAAG